MKLRYKIPAYLLVLLAVLLLLGAATISYSARCVQPSETQTADSLIHAITYNCYGSSEVLILESIEMPVPAANQVLVKVESASVNPLDWHYMRGSPYLMRIVSGIGRPKITAFGSDYAGVVADVGSDVTGFKQGDRVFGTANGAFSDYLVVNQDKAIAIMPASSSFDEAAGVSIAATTAIQALRNKGNIKEGDKVLINGASGGVGTYAVQLAKYFGAEVTGVSSAKNHELVYSLGADAMIDYKVENVVDGDVKFDLIIDNVGNFSPADFQNILADDGAYVLVGGSPGDWIGPFKNVIKLQFIKPKKQQVFTDLLAELSQQDLNIFSALMESGELKTIIDRRYSLEQVPEAIDYSESGRARGKIIINI